jgi:O-antigen/teichoic acid export membrane protein
VATPDFPGSGSAPAVRPQAIGRRLWRGVSRTLVTAVFVQGSTLALNLFAARLLSRAEFGDFLLLVATTTTIGALGQVASGYTATKYLAEFRTRDRDRAGRIGAACLSLGIIGGVIAAAALALGADWLSAEWLRTPHLQRAFLAVAAFVPFVTLNGQRAGVLAGLESYTTAAAVGAVGGIAYFVLGAVGLVTGGLVGGVIGLGIAAVMQWVVAEYAVRRALAAHGIRAAARPTREDNALVVHFAVPAALGGISSLVTIWLAGALLVRHAGGGDEFALFGVANTARTMVLFVPQALASVGTTLLNHHLGDAPHYRRVFWSSVGLAVVVAVTGAAVLAIVAGPIVRLFGDGFGPAARPLRILMIAAVAEAVSNTIYQVIQSRAQMWRSAWTIALPRDALLLVLAYLLTRAGHGASGLAVAYAVAWCFALTVTSVWTWRLGLGGDNPPRPAIA